MSAIREDRSLEDNASPATGRLLTETHLVDRPNISVVASRKWRSQGRSGPVFLKLGSLVRYRLENVETCLASCLPGSERLNSTQEVEGTK
jgi:hypothetical protein